MMMMAVSVHLACPYNDCTGTIINTDICPLCHGTICTNCQEKNQAIPGVVVDKHKCNPDTVASVRLLKQRKRCPVCKTPTEKESGCNSMWCTICHTFWDWATGKHDKDKIHHNPHYTEYMRTKEKGQEKAKVEVKENEVSIEELENDCDQDARRTKMETVINHYIESCQKDSWTPSHKMIGYGGSLSYGFERTVKQFLTKLLEKHTSEEYIDVTVEFLNIQIQSHYRTSGRITLETFVYKEDLELEKLYAVKDKDFMRYIAEVLDKAFERHKCESGGGVHGLTFYRNCLSRVHLYPFDQLSPKPTIIERMIAKYLLKKMDEKTIRMRLLQAYHADERQENYLKIRGFALYATEQIVIDIKAGKSKAEIIQTMEGFRKYINERMLQVADVYNTTKYCFDELYNLYNVEGKNIIAVTNVR